MTDLTMWTISITANVAALLLALGIACGPRDDD